MVFDLIPIQGLKPKDLEPMIGQRNRVYKILNRKRPLTMAMVWRLHKGFGIPAESLIRQPDERRIAMRNGDPIYIPSLLLGIGEPWPANVIRQVIFNNNQTLTLC